MTTTIPTVDAPGRPLTSSLAASGAEATNDAVLVAYATRHGSTREVAEAVAAILAEHGLETDVRLAACVKDISPYRSVVLGSALYFGRLHADAIQFLHRHREALAGLPVAIFAMGPHTLARDEVAQSQAQLARGLAAEPGVIPLSTEIFGGVVDPSQGFSLIRMPASDARDWTAIRAWGNTVADELARSR